MNFANVNPKTLAVVVAAVFLEVTKKKHEQETSLINDTSGTQADNSQNDDHDGPPCETRCESPPEKKEIDNKFTKSPCAIGFADPDLTKPVTGVASHFASISQNQR